MLLDLVFLPNSANNMLYRLGLQPYNAAHLILLSIITSTTKYKLSNIGCFFKRWHVAYL